MANHATATQARTVLIILGFKGINDFAAKSGIQHETVAIILGASGKPRKKRARTFLQVHEALHTAYLDVKGSLTKGTRLFVIDWVKSWKKWVMAELLTTESPGKWTAKAESPDAVYQRKHHQRTIRRAVLQSLSGLKWE